MELNLHVMVSYSKLVKLVLPVCIIGCTSNSGKENLILQELTNSIETSSITINKSSETIYKALDDRITDPYEVEKANFWNQNSKTLYKSSKDLYNYIDGLKAKLQQESSVKTIFFEQKKGEELYNKLKKYREEILGIEQSIKENLEKSIVVITNDFDSNKIKPDFADYFFKAATTDEVMALLTKFQNNIKVNENKIVAFCFYKIPSRHGYCDFFSAIIGQNKSVLKPGETFEINAGVGNFSQRFADPEILFNGTEIKTNGSGVSTYRRKVSTNPGKYFVPVKVSYKDQDGKTQIIEQTIEYTVSNCRN